MKRIIALLAVVAATGCTHLNYTSPTGEQFSRTALGLNVSMGSLDVLTDTNGIRSVSLRGYMSDSTATAAAIAEGVAKGVTTGMKP